MRLFLKKKKQLTVISALDTFILILTELYSETWASPRQGSS